MTHINSLSSYIIICTTQCDLQCVICNVLAKFKYDLMAFNIIFKYNQMINVYSQYKNNAMETNQTYFSM